MRNKRLMVLFALAVAASAPADAQSTAFTYQGRLADRGVPADGLYDLTLKLFSVASGSKQISKTFILDDVTVTGGFFTVELDFGAPAFDGNDRWLEIGVRPGASAPGDPYTTLTPRQPLTPVPYALFAPTAGTAVNIAGGFSGEVSGSANATVVSNAVSANTADAIVRRDGTGGFAAGSLSLSGNLNLLNTNGAGSVGVITKGGSPFLHDFGTNNTFLGALAGNTTFSGGSNVAVGTQGLRNLSSGDWNIAVGALAGVNLNTGSNNIYIGNSGSSFESETIRIGVNQNAAHLGSFSLLGGLPTESLLLVTPVPPSIGSANTGFGTRALAGLGSAGSNSAFGWRALESVANGNNNSAFGTQGLRNLSSGDWNIAVGALAGVNLNTGSNNIYIGNSGSSFESETIRIGVNQNAAHLGSFSLLGGLPTESLLLVTPVPPSIGSANTGFGTRALAGLGSAGSNSAFGWRALESVANGNNNSAFGTQALRNMSGGTGNVAVGALAGLNLNSGNNNIYIGSSGGASSESETIRIGVNQNAAYLGSYSLLGGLPTESLLLVTPAPPSIGSANTGFGTRALAGLGSAGSNSAFGWRALESVANGNNNSAFGTQALRNMSGGTGNVAVGALAGLNLNSGSNNIYIGSSGGASSEFGTIRLGNATDHTATFLHGAVTMPGAASIGGNLSLATSALSFGSATRQMINLWSTGYGIGVQSATTYFRSDGGFAWFQGGVHSDTTFDPGASGSALMTVDETGLTVNGTVVSSSDRDAKQDVQAVDVLSILERVDRLPINEWSYKAAPKTRHVGPMAQDFRAAFGLGSDDRHIAMVDADGVALAAIQGLHRLAERQARELSEQRRQLEAQRELIRDLAERLGRLEAAARP